MSHRIDYAQAAPEGYKAFGGVYAYLRQCGLPETLVNLVYLRVSQINRRTIQRLDIAVGRQGTPDLPTGTEDQDLHTAILSCGSARSLVPRLSVHFAFSRYQSTVCSNPSSSPIIGCQPSARCASEMSRA